VLNERRLCDSCSANLRDSSAKDPVYGRLRRVLDLQAENSLLLAECDGLRAEGDGLRAEGDGLRVAISRLESERWQAMRACEEIKEARWQRPEGGEKPLPRAAEPHEAQPMMPGAIEAPLGKTG